jgi:hypothetical protein
MKPIIIPDINFKLCLINTLRKQKLVPKFNKKKFWQDTFGAPYDDYADYAYQSVPEVIAYYQNFEIDKSLLDKITKIQWSGSEDIIFDINSQWDGEDNTFEISSLAGIELCEKVEKIDLTLGLDPMPWEIKKLNLQKTFVSLSPLAKLPKLKELTLAGFLQDIEVLLEIPSLKKLQIAPHSKILEVTENRLDYEAFKTNIQQSKIKWL